MTERQKKNPKKPESQNGGMTENPEKSGLSDGIMEQRNGENPWNP